MTKSEDYKKTIKEVVRQVDLDYRTKVKEAEKKLNLLRKESEKVAEREKAEARAKKEKADKEAKEEYLKVKSEASQIHIELVLDLVKNAIMDSKARRVTAMEEKTWQGESCRRSGSVSSKTSIASSSCGSTNKGMPNTNKGMPKEDAEVREWVEYAADRLETHMSKSQVRQRILEDIAQAAMNIQLEAQEKSLRRTQDLEEQLAQLRLQQQEQQQQLLQSQSHGPPPAYSIDERDYSKLGMAGSKKA